MVLGGLRGLYALKYDSATAYGLPLYLCSYKLVGSTTFSIEERPEVAQVDRMAQAAAEIRVRSRWNWNTAFSGLTCAEDVAELTNL